MSKLLKAFKSPLLFTRDLLNNKFPISERDIQINPFKNADFLTYMKKTQLISNDLAVDVVYTYVDNTDPLWQEKYQTYIKSNNTDLYDSKAIYRFRTHGELYLSLLGVQKFMPWVRRIFIVTDHQVTDIPQGIKNKTTYINHSEIIDKKFLPTFNSNVIEAHIHKIKNLSDYFIYFNDDVIPTRPLKKEHFFRANGIASVFLSKREIIDNNFNKKMDDLQALQFRNSVDFLKSIGISYSKFNELSHTYIPLNKKIINKIYEKYFINFSMFYNKFRGSDDLKILTFIAPYIMYKHQMAIESMDLTWYLSLNKKQTLNKIRLLNNIANRPQSICLNDINNKEQHASEITNKIKQLIMER